ncbi:hypothetical protein C5167_020282 [Papaver somniferum]|uniref:AMP-dependent synthetase/ligase domain-containing protein n=1 Tax=Papaver somniferum TaxID=3469 RepID=A0A4Y7IWS6_PAPSO|nr:hypothetical protein C5167_020282 [Papaver somniferum]
MDLLKPSPANSSPLTPLGFQERAATVYGDCTSIIYNKTTYTWSQTNRRCLQLASSLKSMAMYELHFAVRMSGAILNTINTRLDARTLSVILCHSESKLIFVDLLSRSLVLEAFSLFRSGVNSPILICIMDDDVHSISTVDGYDPDFTYENLISKGNPDFKWVRPNSEWDPMVLNYTSGTTSSPKGAVHSHRGLFIVTVGSMMDWSVPKQPIFLWTVPMFHTSGWSFSWGMAAVGGLNICLRKFDATSVYGLIHQHGVTHMCGAPVVLNMLANNSMLYAHQAINEAAVVARPDSFWGETPCAFVSLKSKLNKPSENDIIEFCREKLPHYMVPKTIVFEESLPKTTTGKIQKFKLKSKAKNLGLSRAESRI